jgi:RNA polymerase sigma factor (TIGR02999 family)
MITRVRGRLRHLIPSPSPGNGGVMRVDFAGGRDEPSAPAIMNDATLLLSSIARGDTQAAESLLALVYDELRHLAAHRMSLEAPGQTLQPTALVHEAWLRLTGGGRLSVNDRAHFFSLAAEAMRRILIDRARRKRARRHGGEHQRVDLEGCEFAAPDADDRMLAVHDALDKLAREHPLQAELVKLRYFAGMTNEETAQILDISVSTAKNYWTFARAWLFHEISKE